MDQIDLEKNETDDCAGIIDVMAFITFWGPSICIGNHMRPSTIKG